MSSRDLNTEFTRVFHLPLYRFIGPCAGGLCFDVVKFCDTIGLTDKVEHESIPEYLNRHFGSDAESLITTLVNSGLGEVRMTEPMPQERK